MASAIVPQPQPDVVSAQIPGQGVVRTSHVRVSERVPLTQLRLKSYGPIYNELAHDVSSHYIIPTYYIYCKTRTRVCILLNHTSRYLNTYNS